MRRYQKDHPNFKGNQYEKIDNETLKGIDSKDNNFIVDSKYYDELSKYCWLQSTGRITTNGSYFCARKSRKDGHKMMMLHNFLWEINFGKIPNGYLVDHIDQNPANNKICNLRLSDKSKNSINTSLRKNNNTGFTGICYDKNKQKYRAYINYNKKRIELGVFEKEEDAIQARLVAEKEYCGLELSPQKELFEKYGIEDNE